MSFLSSALRSSLPTYRKRKSISIDGSVAGMHPNSPKGHFVTPAVGTPWVQIACRVPAARATVGYSHCGTTTYQSLELRASPISLFLLRGPPFGPVLRLDLA